MTFNLFGPPTKCDIKVGYVSTDRGYVSGIGIHEANLYAKQNPGTTFIFATRERIKYLNINGVNQLTPNDLQSNVDDCKGIQMDKKSDDAPVQVIFMGGGGIGAKANPIIGKDGALIGIDMVSRGFGYLYPPTVEVRDESGIAAGAVVTVGIGTTATVYKTYDDEEDFEEYDLQTCAPPIVGLGSVFGPGGENLGSWDPSQYINPSKTPFQETVEEYIRTLRSVQNPWWTTRKEPPLKVTGDGKTTKVFYKVDSHYWGEFQNSYAISPKPKSNAKGSDFAGRWYTFEWDLDVPFDGEYKFRGTRDNRAKLYINNEFISDLDNYKGAVTPVKKNLKEGIYSLRLELFNIPVTEKYKVQDGGPQQQIRKETQVAGADFIKKSNGYYMTVGGNVETEVSLKLTYDDKIKTAGTAITKIVIPNPDGKDIVLERKKSGDTYKEKGSVSGKSVFKRSEDGYGPIQLSGNDGSSKLVRKNKAYGPAGGKYGQINFFDTHGTDVNASLNILGSVNLQDQREVKGKITGLKSTETQQIATVFNTIDWIDKANRKLWRTNVYNRGGFLNEYGICPFDTMIQLEDNPYAGSHKIVWSNVNFPVTGNYVVEIEVDDNVNLKIGDQVAVRKEGFVNGKSDRPTGKSRYVYSIKEGTYNITADLDQIPGGKFGFSGIKGINPMALAINIQTVYAEKERVIQKSFNENPMAVALTIQAPAPPIPQAPIPKQEGRCPPNPFWTTRFPTKTQWHPVVHPAWGKFMNKYAMSPVPPYDTKNTSGSGIWWGNEWTVDIPYDGYYKLKAAADNEAKFWVNGELVLNLSNKALGRIPGVTRSLNWFGGWGTKVKPPENKFFLSAGLATIKVEVHNHKYEETKLIDQKIFNTSDWVAGSTLPASSQKPGKMDIIYVGLSGANKPIRVVNDGKRIELKDSHGDDINCSFTIESGNVKFSADGKRLEGIGSATIVMRWDDKVDIAGVAVESIRIGKTIWVQKETKGTHTHTLQVDPLVTFQASEKGVLAGGTVKNGVTYEGPRLASYRTDGTLGRLFSPFHTDPREIFDKTWRMKWKDVNFPAAGQYTIRLLADDTLRVWIDGREVGFAKVFQHIRTYNFDISQGRHTIEMEIMNIPAPDTHTFRLNPVVGGVIITRKVRVGTGIVKPWSVNPVGVSAKLIPPPCPQTIGGKGILDPVRPIVPGNGYRPPTGPGYPVALRLKEIIVKKPGINYNCAEDQVVIEPNEGGAKLSLCDCGPFGTINKVCVDDPGLGFTRWPDIRIISDTGINFEGTPVFEVIRDPVKVDLDKLIQVTDLVGVKQTGYYDGRAYFGAVFYKEGVRYAGYYETAGELVQIYDTLQESIDAQVTTPASAILRQGTDISSDDPRLDIPGTPDNLV